MHDKYNFDNLAVLKGGINAWRERGLPTVKAPPDLAGTGRNLYMTHCGSCHGSQGDGLAGEYPPLQKDALLNHHTPGAAAFITLAGLSGRKINGKPYKGTMPAFAKLTDKEIATILTYARTHFGNYGAKVEPEQVREQRRGLAP